jgi:hypothetical protein
MSIQRDDRWISDAQGRALAGAQVYWCVQPAITASNPPSPLATVYATIAGGTPIIQPVLTDGFGHAFAYLDNSILYTVVVWHPLFGTTPVVLLDQAMPGAGGGAGYTPVQASTNVGTITGSGTTWNLPSMPVSGSLVLQRNGQVLTPGLGYSISGAVITLATSLGSSENLNANYLFA